MKKTGEKKKWKRSENNRSESGRSAASAIVKEFAESAKSSWSGWASLARSIDLPRVDREGAPRSSLDPPRVHLPSPPFLPYLIFFLGIVARSSNFTIRLPPGDELLKRDARWSRSRFPRERYSKLDRVAQVIDGGGKIAGGNNRVVAPRTGFFSDRRNSRRFSRIIIFKIF